MSKLPSAIGSFLSLLDSFRASFEARLREPRLSFPGSEGSESSSEEGLRSRWVCAAHQLPLQSLQSPGGVAVQTPAPPLGGCPNRVLTLLGSGWNMVRYSEGPSYKWP